MFIAMAELGANLSKAITYHEAYQYAVQIPPLYRKRIQHYDDTRFSDIFENVDKHCRWLSTLGDTTENEFNKNVGDFQKVKDENDAALIQFEQLTIFFKKLYDEVIDLVESTAKFGSEYIDKKITKLKFAEGFDSPFLTKAVQNLAKTNAILVDVNTDYSDEITKGKDIYVSLYNKLAKLALPILNNYTVYQLELVKAAELVNDTGMQELVNSLRTNIDVLLPELVAETYNRLSNPTEEITDSVDDLIAHIDPLNENLKEYKASTKMDTEFFM